MKDRWELMLSRSEYRGRQQLETRGFTKLSLQVRKGDLGPPFT